MGKAWSQKEWDHLRSVRPAVTYHYLRWSTTLTLELQIHRDLHLILGGAQRIDPIEETKQEADKSKGKEVESDAGKKQADTGHLGDMIRDLINEYTESVGGSDVSRARKSVQEVRLLIEHTGSSFGETLTNRVGDLPHLFKRKQVGKSTEAADTSGTAAEPGSSKS